MNGKTVLGAADQKGRSGQATSFFTVVGKEGTNTESRLDSCSLGGGELLGLVLKPVHTSGKRDTRRERATKTQRKEYTSLEEGQNKSYSEEGGLTIILRLGYRARCGGSNQIGAEID